MQFDLTRPNTGRMYDYWLGGHHNFEIDRQFADQATRNSMFAAESVQQIRSSVKRFVEHMYRQGIRVFLDFGASLPTCNNTHLVAQALDPNVRVVYSDIDPITVAYAQEILSETRNVIYLHADATHPETVLQSPQTLGLIGAERKVGFLFLNLSHIIADAQFHSALQILYDWAAPGSYLALSQASELWNTEPDLVAIANSYRLQKITPYFRSQAEILMLVSRWKLAEPGIVNNWDWGAAPASVFQKRVLGYSMLLAK